MTPWEEYIGHPIITYCAFQSDIFEIDGYWYVQEDFQDGEIWSDEEIWGSTLYDLENKRKIEWPVYITDNDEWKNIIPRDDQWSDMDYEFETDAYKESIEYYLTEINKLKDEQRRIREEN